VITTVVKCAPRLAEFVSPGTVTFQVEFVKPGTLSSLDRNTQLWVEEEQVIVLEDWLLCCLIVPSEHCLEF